VKSIEPKVNEASETNDKVRAMYRRVLARDPSAKELDLALSYLTDGTLQQLFVMNSAFIQGQAAALAKRVEGEGDVPAKLRAMYRRVLARDPSARELDLALTYLNSSTLEQYAQALLSSNEVIFWP